MKKIMTGILLLSSLSSFANICGDERIADVSNRLSQLEGQLSTSILEMNKDKKFNVDGVTVEYHMERSFSDMESMLNYRGEALIELSAVKSDIENCQLDLLADDYNSTLLSFAQTAMQQDQSNSSIHQLISTEEYNRLKIK